MTDFLANTRRRRHIRDIPLAPVLDLLTVVIFFLLLSTSFAELTKQTLPPSAVNTLTDPNAALPLGLKIFMVRSGPVYKLAARWSGTAPGGDERTLRASADENLRVRDIRDIAGNFAEGLRARFPREAAVQVGLGSNISYQEVIAVMDGVRAHFDDLVLVSPQDAEAQGR